jgi:hypothetical protein
LPPGHWALATAPLIACLAIGSIAAPRRGNRFPPRGGATRLPGGVASVETRRRAGPPEVHCSSRRPLWFWSADLGEKTRTWTVGWPTSACRTWARLR